MFINEANARFSRRDRRRLQHTNLSPIGSLSGIDRTTASYTMRRSRVHRPPPRRTPKAVMGAPLMTMCFNTIYTLVPDYFEVNTVMWVC